MRPSADVGQFIPALGVRFALQAGMKKKSHVMFRNVGLQEAADVCGASVVDC